MTRHSDANNAVRGGDLAATALDSLRYTGYRGGFLVPHRALLSSPFGASKLLVALGLTAVGVGLWALVSLTDWGRLPVVDDLWTVILSASAQALRLAGAATRTETYPLVLGLELHAPALYVPVGLPTRWVWQLGIAVCAALVAISVVLPDRFRPVAYLLRVIALVQILSQVFFAYWPNSFPYTAGGYIHTMLIASIFFIGLVPGILALTYYLFDFRLRDKVLLTVMIMGHLTILVPLQYAAQAFVLYHLSLLFLPVLFLVFGLPLNVLVLIAFFGWGFAWKHPLRERAVQWRVRNPWA